MSNDAVAMELKITLNETPATIRNIVVPLSIRYDQLHVLIQLAFGWTNSHLYAFMTADRQQSYEGYVEGGDVPFGNPPIQADKAYVYPDLENGPLAYTYDFGDDWEHEIKLVKLLDFNDIHDIALPSCVSGKGRNHQEDRMTSELGQAFSKKRINNQLELWSHAGEQMIRADDMGLMPKY
ncbi:plasmid pRiA4b ORF-3 family protein [Companilactobacillus furfuricola]|uniref:plasmid pRiA4b ORF-3 family protein n=1 Tax=Companilactobacillus furfuricola TaxID=1462575 RepID=UPI000F78C5DB|nr:plasmid pRiA4b ORF-3 family protein [Companilactobacillus furfuricola]